MKSKLNTLDTYLDTYSLKFYISNIIQFPYILLCSAYLPEVNIFPQNISYVSISGKKTTFIGITIFMAVT